MEVLLAVALSLLLQHVQVHRLLPLGLLGSSPCLAVVVGRPSDAFISFDIAGNDKVGEK